LDSGLPTSQHGLSEEEEETYLDNVERSSNGDGSDGTGNGGDKVWHISGNTLAVSFIALTLTPGCGRVVGDVEKVLLGDSGSSKQLMDQLGPGHSTVSMALKRVTRLISQLNLQQNSPVHSSPSSNPNLGTDSPILHP
jgi:hypothetical protein